VKQSLLGHGFEAVGNTPAQFSEFIRNEILKWAKIIAEAGIRAE
jgi:tripartite-type tricarboxylate transporter receptor subunit TctC